jgi:ABC-2 type transport system permease protein
MKTWIIVKKEYKDIVKKKSFLIATILTPAMMVAFIFIPALIAKVSREEKIIEVLDYSGLVQEQLLKKSKNDKEAVQLLKLKFQPVKEKSQEQENLIKTYEQRITDKKPANLKLIPEFSKKILNETIAGLILIPGNVKETRRIYFCALNISDLMTNKYISSTVRKILSELILTEQNIELKIVEEAIREIKLNTFKVKKEGTTKEGSNLEYTLSFIMLAILLSIIMIYGQLIMRVVIEEKNNRIIEVLISSTNAQSLFYGKIIGIGLAGLTQVAVWALLAVAVLSRPPIRINTGVMNFFTPELAFYFVVFFIIGYFMYSLLFAIVGASVNSDYEAQQFSAPISYLLFIPFIIGVVVTQSTNTPLVIITSMFPLFTPTLMFMRISVSIPSFSQVALSIVISILFTMFLAWVGAKIFRVGILMYGKRPSVNEIIKWIKYK